MTKKTNFKLSSFLTNNWVITLTATLFGVFAGLYLNEWVASNNLSNERAIATENLVSEIASNKKRLEGAIKKHVEMLETIEFFGEYVDEEENLITSSEIMHAFSTKYPHIIKVKDSTLLSDGNYKYNGQVNIDLSLPHLDLSTIVWETIKNSGFISTYGFECLMYLETVDKVTHDIRSQNQALLGYLVGTKESGDKNEYLIKHLTFLLAFEKSLIEIYNSSKEELKNCR